MDTKLTVEGSSNPVQSQESIGMLPDSKEKTASADVGSEFWGRHRFDQLISYIDEKKGQFLRDDDGKLYVVLSGKRISLTPHPENVELKKLVLEACSVSTQSRASQVALERLQVKANQTASRLHLRRFSALSSDRNRLYVPLRDGSLLRVTAENIDVCPNGYKEDSFWIEHPNGEPLDFKNVDPRQELPYFERLLVDTQACRQPEMRWFVAVHEGLFPYVREMCPARFILVHEGSTQQGKTSGAERFTILHGLGGVQGDCSLAALNNMGDMGLLVMDNKEQANLTQPFIDYLLFLATGAERRRSTTDGVVRSTNRNRPAAVITTIEGVYKQELEARCIAVTYQVTGTKIPRAEIQEEIADQRFPITSALILVIQRFLQVRRERRPTPNPLPSFEEHFTTLCNLLRAYGQIAGKGDEWSEKIIAAWERAIRSRISDEEENELEYPIRSLFEKHTSPIFPQETVTFKGRKGTLHVTEANRLLHELRSQPLSFSLPQTPNALSRRIRSTKFRSFLLLDDENAPDLAVLKRKANRRPLGIFVPADDAVTVDGA